MRVVTFKIEEDLLTLLDKYAIKHGINRSVAIRKAIEDLVKADMANETVPTLKVEKIRL